MNSILQRFIGFIHRSTAPTSPPSAMEATDQPPMFTPTEGIGPSRYVFVNNIEVFHYGMIHIRMVGFWAEVNETKDVLFKARIPPAYLHKDVDQLTDIMVDNFKRHSLYPKCVDGYYFGRIHNTYLIGQMFYFKASYFK